MKSVDIHTTTLERKPLCDLTITQRFLLENMLCDSRQISLTADEKQLGMCRHLSIIYVENHTTILYKKPLCDSRHNSSTYVDSCREAARHMSTAVDDICRESHNGFYCSVVCQLVRQALFSRCVTC